MELASCYHYGTYDLEVATQGSENLCTHKHKNNTLVMNADRNYKID